jgi:hypothetical protein
MAPHWTAFWLLWWTSDIDHAVTLDEGDLPGNTTEDGNGGAASADGDVQAGDIDAQQGLDQAHGEGVDLARVLYVLAAHRGGGGRARAFGGNSDGGEGKEGGEELHG